MANLSRQCSRQPLLKPDDTSSLTSFPDPSASALLFETNHRPLDGLLDTSGPSIFDDESCQNASNAQNLSAAPSEVLQSVIDHQGAVYLVRRLARLLAERDAHITALTRLAEEYKIPSESIADTASRTKQTEQRRLALTTAANEDLAVPATSKSRVRSIMRSLCWTRSLLTNH